MRIQRPLLALLFFSAGCSTDEFRLTERTETTISPSGGQALSADGDLTLTFPAGALPTATTIVIETDRSFEHDRLRSPRYVFGPDGLTFAAPIQARLHVVASGDLAFARLDGTPTIVEGSVHDSMNNEVRAPLAHFSSYGAITTWDPCGGAACGDGCSPCAPLDLTCTSSAAGTCDQQGRCRTDTSSVSCGGGGAQFVATSSITIGPVLVTRTGTASFDVYNTGGSMGSILSLSASPSQFSASASLPASVPPGGSSSIEVSFTPLGPGVVQGTLLISTTHGTVSVGLTGIGLESHVPDLCTETHVQPWLGELDVLVLVDNSGSMLDEAAAIREMAGTLMTAIALADVDYHVAVTTTDLEPGSLQGRLTTTSSGVSVVTRSIVDPVSTLEELLDIGTVGSEIERGFDVIQQVVTATSAVCSGTCGPWCAGEEPGCANPGCGCPEPTTFLRDTAWLTIIAISDEDDVSSIAAWELIDHLHRVKGVGSERMVRINGIVGGANGCATAQPSFRWNEAVDGTSGVRESICSPPWTQAPAELGRDILGLPYRYPLQGDPIPSSIRLHTVTSSASGFLYDGPTNTVVLHDVPPAGSSISIEYLGTCE